MMTCARCEGVGWICEAHPEMPSMHDGCDEPGEPCPVCNTSEPPRKPKGWVSLVSAETEPFYKPGKKPAPPRQPKSGEGVWRLRDAGGRMQSCELRDNARAGAGWEVQILEAGEILVSRQCVSEVEARFVANNARKDLLRTGWAVEERKADS